jgi:hypothetical protein
MVRGETTSLEMDTGKYELSFRVWHPAMSPEEISVGLRSKPNISWCVGEPRRTPKGAALPGVYDETYWVADVSEPPTPVILAMAIAEMLSDLETKASFLQRVAETQGTAEVLVIWSGSGGLTLPAGLLQRMSALNINLSIDIYT